MTDDRLIDLAFFSTANPTNPIGARESLSQGGPESCGDSGGREKLELRWDCSLPESGAPCPNRWTADFGSASGEAARISASFIGERADENIECATYSPRMRGYVPYEAGAKRCVVPRRWTGWSCHAKCAAAASHHGVRCAGGGRILDPGSIHKVAP